MQNISKYADWLKQSTPRFVVSLAMFVHLDIGPILNINEQEPNIVFQVEGETLLIQWWGWQVGSLCPSCTAQVWFFLYKLIFKIMFARYLIVRHGMNILIKFFLPRNRDRPPSKQWPEVIVRIIHKTPHKIASILFQALGDAAFSFQFEGSEMVSCTFKCIGPSEGIPLCWYWAPWHHLRNGVQENFLVYTRPLIKGRFEK